MSEEIRWGVVGPGRIAESLVPDFAVVDGARCVAVASRSQERADDFARRHGIERAHGSYAAILADPHDDLVRLFPDEVEARLPYWLVARPEALRQPAVATFVEALRARMREVQAALLGT